VETPPELRRAREYVPGKTQTDLVIGLPGIARNDPDYYAILAGDTVLGRLGMGGRLGAEIRERRGLAYHASTGFDAGYGPGPWAARAGVAPRDVDAAIAAALEVFQRFRDDGPTEAELADARQLLTGSLPLRLETTDGMASIMLTIERFGLGLDYVDRYPLDVGAVTVEQVIAAVRRHLLLDRVVVSSAGPGEEGAGANAAGGA
jgi:zinc protease